MFTLQTRCLICSEKCVSGGLLWEGIGNPAHIMGTTIFKKVSIEEDGGNIGGSGVHFPSTPGKYLADLRSRANNQQYSSIYEDQRPKIEDIERSDGKKSA